MPTQFASLVAIQKKKSIYVDLCTYKKVKSLSTCIYVHIYICYISVVYRILKIVVFLKLSTCHYRFPLFVLHNNRARYDGKLNDNVTPYTIIVKHKV